MILTLRRTEGPSRRRGLRGEAQWRKTLKAGTGRAIRARGRTGLTALVVAVLFLASLFLAPLAQTVPPYATAPALLFVACLMATSLGAIQWDEPTEYIPALTIALMIPLSYSIATGIGLGFIAYVALKLMSGRVRDINGASAAIAGAFLLKLIFA